MYARESYVILADRERACKGIVCNPGGQGPYMIGNRTETWRTVTMHAREPDGMMHVPAALLVCHAVIQQFGKTHRTRQLLHWDWLKLLHWHGVLLWRSRSHYT